MRTSSLIVLTLQCLQVLVSPEEHGREKRELNMLRMGKRGSVVVPARAIDLPPLVPPNYELGDEFEERELIIPEDALPRQVWIPRVGKEIDYEGRFTRAPPFPRLGKLYDDYLSEYRRELTDDDLRQVLLKYPQLESHGRSKRSIGDDTKKTEKKRALPRLGLRDEEYLEEDERAAPLPRLGLMNRAAPLPRLGLQERSFPRLGLQERSFPRLGLQERSFPRLGLQERSFPRLGLREYDDYYMDTDNEEERAAPLPRLGLREAERALPIPRMGYRDAEKRAMGMLRMGRSDGSEPQEEEEKRALSMLRMGKRAMGMLRMGKRPMSMLRMGRSQETEHEGEKRALSMLRMGKRAMGMLRMGRSDGSETENQNEKRAMGMLRMGKRAMGMLRMGRSDGSEAEKRAMGMLRMGRGMSMLRMGRSEGSAPDQEKRAMGMLRMGKRPMSMLRMGKRDTDSVQGDDNEDGVVAKTQS